MQKNTVFSGDRDGLCLPRVETGTVGLGVLGSSPAGFILCSFPFWFQIQELNRRMSLVEGILNHLERRVVSPAEQVWGFIFTTVHSFTAVKSITSVNSSTSVNAFTTVHSFNTVEAYSHFTHSIVSLQVIFHHSPFSQHITYSTLFTHSPLFIFTTTMNHHQYRFDTV